MLSLILIILGVLISINILLLVFSCNPSENNLKNIKTEKKPILPKGLNERKSKHIIFADK